MPPPLRVMLMLKNDKPSFVPDHHASLAYQGASMLKLLWIKWKHLKSPIKRQARKWLTWSPPCGTAAPAGSGRQDPPGPCSSSGEPVGFRGDAKARRPKQGSNEIGLKTEIKERLTVKSFLIAQAGVEPGILRFFVDLHACRDLHWSIIFKLAILKRQNKHTLPGKWLKLSVAG